MSKPWCINVPLKLSFSGCTTFKDLSMTLKKRHATMNLHKENAQERPTNKMPYTAVQNTQNVNSFFFFFFSLLLQTIHITH